MDVSVEYKRAFYSICVALLICYQANKKKSLNHSGCLAAFIVGTLTFYSGYRFGIFLYLIIYVHYLL